MGEARLSAYEAFCGDAAKYEAPQMRYETKPFQASCFLPGNLGNISKKYFIIQAASDACASYLRKQMLHIVKRQWNNASSSGVFYEAFCGDAAKYEAHLVMHEAALRAMKQSLTASFRHFFCKKNGGEGGIRTRGTVSRTTV